MTEEYDHSIRGQIIVENPPRAFLANLFSTRAGKMVGEIKNMVSLASDGDVKVGGYRPTGASKIEDIGKGLNDDNTLLTLVGEGNLDEIKLKFLIVGSGYSIKAYDTREFN